MSGRRSAFYEENNRAQPVEIKVNVAASKPMEMPRELAQMQAEELRNLTATLLAQLSDKDAQLVEKDAQLAKRDREDKTKQLKIDQLTHEMTLLKRYRFHRRSEQMDPQQRLLLDESIDADIAAIGLEIDALKEKPAAPPKEKPRRVTLPAEFPGARGAPRAQRYAVQLQLRSGTHRRGCERIIQEPVPPQVIDKGIPTDVERGSASPTRPKMLFRR